MIHDQCTDLGPRRLTGLRKLTASYNNLTSLPESIGECVLLEKIRVVNNHITVSWLKRVGGGEAMRLQWPNDPLIPPINQCSSHRLSAGETVFFVFLALVFWLAWTSQFGYVIYHITAYETMGVHHIIIYVCKVCKPIIVILNICFPHNFDGWDLLVSFLFFPVASFAGDAILLVATLETKGRGIGRTSGGWQSIGSTKCLKMKGGELKEIRRVTPTVLDFFDSCWLTMSSDGSWVKQWKEYNGTLQLETLSTRQPKLQGFHFLVYIGMRHASWSDHPTMRCPWSS